MPFARVLLVVASAAAAALFVRELLGAAVPLLVAALALTGYALLVVVGVLVPRLQMFADVVWRGPTGARGVALTFDDGPHPVHTRAVLAKLADAGAHANFFVLGDKARLHPEVVREIAAAGHLVAIHGGKHDRMLAFRSFEQIHGDLVGAMSEVQTITGVRPHLYRPPVGQTNPRIARAAEKLGLTLVGWSVRGLDGVATTATRVAARVVPRLTDGAIVLMHDAAERDDRSPVAAEALPAILAALAARGLDAVRLDAWISAPEAAAPESASRRAPPPT